MILIESSYFQRFQDSQEEYFEFHNPIDEWLDQYFLARSIIKNRFWYFLMLANEDDTKEGLFTESSRYA